jgi:hypothetical protein
VDGSFFDPDGWNISSVLNGKAKVAYIHGFGESDMGLDVGTELRTEGFEF